MRLRLTDLSIRKLHFSEKGQKTYWDSTTPGFGVRCSTKSKSYVVMYGPKRQLKTIGRHPGMALADARRIAKQELLAPPPSPYETPKYDYAAVLDEYLVDCTQRLRSSTVDGYKLYLRAIPFNGPVDEITRQDILRAIRSYSSAAATQNHAFTTFKVFFNWLVRQQYVSTNPLAGEKRPHAPVARDRVLSHDEIRSVLEYTLNTRDRFNDIVSLLLLTGQRRGEIANMRWDEVDNGWLSLSRERTKNKHRHEIPLSPTALNWLCHKRSFGT